MEELAHPEGRIVIMAEPQRRTGTAQSTVASCSATECRYNEDRQCHAGEIEVRPGKGGAACATYDPQTPEARP